jgi:hypothetical protein
MPQVLIVMLTSLAGRYDKFQSLRMELRQKQYQKMTTMSLLRKRAQELMQIRILLPKMSKAILRTILPNRYKPLMRPKVLRKTDTMDTITKACLGDMGQVLLGVVALTLPSNL